MKAIDFIKEYSIEKAREVVEGAPDGATYYVNEKSKIVVGLHGFYADGFCVGIHNPHTHIKISALKRLVESVDIITKVGGIREAIEEHTKWMHAPELHLYRIGESVERLKQAIADYELLFCSGESK